ncbi:MAG TPA: hypothetical protein VNZ52_02415 [Candidatus Thermoplasmatota archaeon]|nr:hypothetical protein [Candidatus Thermoplasmatota archaeon]
MLPIAFIPSEYTPVFEGSDLLVILTLIFLEGVLSFDNAAVLAALTLKLPPDQRRKALLYGLAGAYVFRTIAIFGAVFIINNPFLLLLGGGYLVFLGVKHAYERFRHHAPAASGEANPEAPKALQKAASGFLGMSAFWSTVLLVELADVAFALDQVLAAVAFVGNDTHKLWVLILASMVAILLLRLSAYYMGRLMEWFPQLEDIAYAVVGFVGVKLCLEYWHIEIPKMWAISVTLGAFLIPITTKVLLDRQKKAKAQA